METFLQDVRYGLRMLGKNPGFAAVAILTIAVGIGSSTTIFSWVRAVLLNPLPGASQPERVVALEMLTPSGEWTPTSYLDFRDFRDHSKLLESMSVTQPMDLAVGDEKQSIFAFQGADPAGFHRMRLQFKKRLSDIDRAFYDGRLDLSFRSAAGIVQAVDAIFARPEAFRGLMNSATP